MLFLIRLPPVIKMTCVAKQRIQTIHDFEEHESNHVERHEEIQHEYDDETTREFRKFTEFQNALRDLERLKTRAHALRKI